jgi:hypothetical protein
MDDWNDIGAFQDYSAFFPDETFDLFGDYQLGSELASLTFPAFPEVEIGGHFTSLSAAANNAQCILDQLDTSPSDSSLSNPPNASTVGPECTDSSPKTSTTEGLPSVQALHVLSERQTRKPSALARFLDRLLSHYRSESLYEAETILRAETEARGGYEQNCRSLHSMQTSQGVGK